MTSRKPSIRSDVPGDLDDDRGVPDLDPVADPEDDLADRPRR